MILIIFKKVLKQIKRDRIMLVLTLICTPFFIFLYKLIYLDGMTKYRIVLVGENSVYDIDKFKSFIQDKQYPGGGDLFEVVEAENYGDAYLLVKEHKVKVLLYIEESEIKVLGNYADPYFVLSVNLLEKFILEFLRGEPSITIEREALGNSRMKSEFESYIPGLYIFSSLILLFLFTLILIREKEAGLYLRYYFSKVKTSSYFIGSSMSFLLISMINLLIATITSYSLGFNSPVSLYMDVLNSLIICSILTLSVIGVCFIVTSLSNNSTQALLLVTFPFMIFVFLSGSVYLFPANDIYKMIPSTIAVNILDGSLTYGEGLLYRPVDLILMILESTGLYFIGYKRLRFV